MVKIFCDSCGNEVSPVTQMFSEMGQKGVEAIADLLDGLMENRSKAEPELMFTEELLSAIGIGSYAIKVSGRFYCKACLERYRETGNMLPAQVLQ